MTDFTHGPDRSDIFGANDPARDVRFGALLREHVGEAPVEQVDFPALAARIRRGVASQVSAPWWSYATRWERRALPLALAAGLAAAAAIWNLGAPSELQAAADPVADVINGTPAADAARLVTRGMTNTLYAAQGELE